jgi:ribose 5-phosphate isomerase B
LVVFPSQAGKENFRYILFSEVLGPGRYARRLAILSIIPTPRAHSTFFPVRQREEIVSIVWARARLFFFENFSFGRMVESDRFCLSGVPHMKIAVACDHAGFPLKEQVLQAVRNAGHEPLDLGAHSLDPADDYPDYAMLVGRAIQAGLAGRGILLCGSGVGASIAANKLKGVYAGVCHDTYSGRQGVEDDDMNVLCLGPRVIGPGLAKEIVAAFLAARFIGNDPGQARHARRVAKIRKLES